MQIINFGLYHVLSTVDGSGANIYVIDTGLNIYHEDFEGRAKVGFDAVYHPDREGRTPNGVSITSTMCLYCLFTTILLSDQTYYF